MRASDIRITLYAIACAASASAAVLVYYAEPSGSRVRITSGGAVYIDVGRSVQKVE